LIWYHNCDRFTKKKTGNLHYNTSHSQLTYR